MYMPPYPTLSPFLQIQGPLAYSHGHTMNCFPLKWISSSNLPSDQVSETFHFKARVPLNIIILQFISPFLAELPSGLPQKHYFRPPVLGSFSSLADPSLHQGFLCPAHSMHPFCSLELVLFPANSRALPPFLLISPYSFLVYINVPSILHLKRHAFHS